MNLFGYGFITTFDMIYDAFAEGAFALIYASLSFIRYKSLTSDSILYGPMLVVGIVILCIVITEFAILANP